VFLRPLNKEQKRLFLNLATAAASADNIIKESEKALLAAYADEMGIDVNDAEDNTMEEVCVRLKEISSAKELNQIAFEIVGMMMSDNEYAEAEKVFVNKMAAIFQISNERIEEMFRCVHDYSVLIKRINMLMYEDKRLCKN